MKPLLRISRPAWVPVLVLSTLLASGAAVGREAQVPSIVPPLSAQCNKLCKDEIANERKDPGAAEDCLLRCRATAQSRKTPGDSVLKTGK